MKRLSVTRSPGVVRTPNNFLKKTTLVRIVYQGHLFSYNVSQHCLTFTSYIKSKQSSVLKKSSFHARLPYHWILQVVVIAC